MPRRSYIGADNPNWKGGTIKAVDGRVLVYCPGDPDANLMGGTHALRYRLVARALVGRVLCDDEIVHHINGDPADDRPENLQVMTQAEHARLHAEARRDPATGQFVQDGADVREAPDRSKTCPVCGRTFIASRRHRLRQVTCGERRCVATQRASSYRSTVAARRKEPHAAA